MKKLIVAAAGLGVAAAGLVGIAAPANAAPAVDTTTYDDCYYNNKGVAQTCVTVQPVTGKAMKTKYEISAYFAPEVLADPAMAGQKVCLYRLVQPNTDTPAGEIAACWMPNSSGVANFYAKLGFIGKYNYNVGPKKLKWNKGNPWFTPDFQLQTKKK